MKVTPVNKPFGKYKVGEVFEFPSKAAKVYIKIGKLADAESVKVFDQAPAPGPIAVGAEVSTIEPEAEISPRTGLPKRVYRRRDMESE